MATRLEAQLKEYRARRRRQYLADNVNDKLENSEDMTMDQEKQEEEVVLLQNEEVQPTRKILIQSEEDVLSEVRELDNATQESWTYFTVKWTIYFIIWLTIYIISLKLEFGAVYFVFSVLIGIYLNTRTGPKKKGEVSAYSVFNENCTSIEGTLNAEQLVKEIMYGPVSFT
ncbi:SAYSvFN domain-containing protein 1 [Battus philenor]|uniref:SAYSvFN domain-containing protein 1 n=1 Tax=Battus philenor TaxID=42288 RepID=UPI0035CEA63F